MALAPSDDRELADLSQVTIRSELYPGASYRLERRIGTGGMGVAFFALRHAPEGIAPIVIKLIRPSVVARIGSTASLVIQKEAVALGRLNESVPPTPFVVRFIDTGAVRLPGTGVKAPLPWIAIEYVHGGVEGTSLEDRLHYSSEKTGYAFDAVRTAHLVRCMASGLSAIHAVGVIHRDLTPSNVLCCGFGEAEIFKISDFGIARPVGMAMTFGDAQLGTVGYTAPEQNSRDQSAVGPSTDTFSLACCVFFALTGEDYFQFDNPVRAMIAIQTPERRSIRESRHLCPELRERIDVCEGIDQVLARATAAEPTQRFSQAQQLATALGPWLGDSGATPKPHRRLVNSLMNLSSPAQVSTWSWTVRHPPGDDRVVRSAAWDGDGRCFAATTRGLEFWNGTAWAPCADADLPAAMHFARRFAAGRWLVGGDDGALAVYATDGVREVVRAPDRAVTFLDANGRFDDILTAVAQRPGSPPELWSMAARRWMKPLPLEKAAYVSSLLRLDDSRWIVCGRLSAGGGGFAAIYTPMMWETAFLLTPPTRAFVGGSSRPERGLALIAGTEGVAVRFDGDRPMSSVIESRPDLTCAAMDVLDREWVASIGRLWVRDPDRDARWQSVWHDGSWMAPFVSIMADAGIVVAMTADGGILEGRAPWHHFQSERPGSLPPPERLA
jgi:serine/threonine protein kinase